MTNLNDKLNIPVDWTKVLIFSGVGIAVTFFLGLLFKVRLLLMIADLGVFLLLIGFLVAGFIALIKKFGPKQNP